MGRSVLVVDDEPGIIEIASAYLRKDGFAVRTATTGQRAIDAVATQMPDLVVLDLMLPDISGEEVCASLRRHSAVPILMLTGKSAEVDRLRGLALGADDLLEDSSVVAYADRDAVRQVATNLLTNALKYAPENQPVRLVTDLHGEMARMSVVDRGVIPGVERSRVFERFYRGSARDDGGAGLGLTIARSLAEAQGGRLEVKARDSGTSFELTLRTGPRSSPKRPRPPSRTHKRAQPDNEPAPPRTE